MTGKIFAVALLAVALVAGGTPAVAEQPPVPYGGELPGPPGAGPRLADLGPWPKLPPAPKPHRVRLKSSGDYIETVLRVPTAQKIVFLTIDDGGYQPPEADRVLAEANVPTSFFLISSPATQHPAFFRQLQDDRGASIQAHTQSHKQLKGLPEETQRFEICGSVDKLTGVSGGKRPTLFRPPYGVYDLTTLKVAQSCGGLAAMMMWEGSVLGGVLYIGQRPFHPVNNPLYPGMVLLMHFTPEFERDMHVLVNAIAASPGYSAARLEDYVN